MIENAIIFLICAVILIFNIAHHTYDLANKVVPTRSMFLEEHSILVFLSIQSFLSIIPVQSHLCFDSTPDLEDYPPMEPSQAFC
jgi:hypothetical protein